ncbi:MAG: DUF429 domain-containing protein [Gemmatimonadales bacterium]
MSQVVGIDGWKSGWLGVVLDGSDVSFHFASSLGGFVERFSSAGALVVDVPIGFPVEGRRDADSEARRFVGRRASSVFATPPAAPLHAPSYEDALGLCRELYGFGLSRQSYALREKILEADALVEGGAPLIEGHPEVSFAALKGAHLGFAKRTWNGQMERRLLLASVGIELSDALPAEIGRAPADDVLDAAVMAWTARRVAKGEAMPMPDPPEQIGGRPVAIWY